MALAGFAGRGQWEQEEPECWDRSQIGLSWAQSLQSHTKRLAASAEQYFMTPVTEHDNINRGTRIVFILLYFRYILISLAPWLETQIHIPGSNSFLVHIEAVIKAYCQMRLYSRVSTQRRPSLASIFVFSNQIFADTAHKGFPHFLIKLLKGLKRMIHIDI